MDQQSIFRTQGWLRINKGTFLNTISLGKIQLLKELWELATPKNITYWWGFGSALGLTIVVQVVTGLILTFYYTAGTEAWESVVLLTREVSRGWLLRLVHGNVASLVFIVLFIHMFRGMFFTSFYLKGPWLSGWLIMALTIIAAFLGYVLPWGQMSFWGATVIINLLRVLPSGGSLVIWLWGGFYVSYLTCRFFYSLHFLVPFIILILALVHLVLLHFTGRRVPSGQRMRNSLKTKFQLLFIYKDIVNITLFWRFWLFFLKHPDWSADPVNFIVSDLSSSPLHIQPEWYFLNLYAILRSIPNKLGGLIGFALALVLLTFLRLVIRMQKLNHVSLTPWIFWTFVSTNLLLLWLGRQPVEAPYIVMGQVLTGVYFTSMFSWNLIDFMITKTW